MKQHNLPEKKNQNCDGDDDEGGDLRPRLPLSIRLEGVKPPFIPGGDFPPPSLGQETVRR